MASTVPTPESNLSTSARPIVLNAVASPGWADLAKPFPALTNRSPLRITPVHCTGTRPVIATGGCVESDPAPLFIKYAALVLMTPNTESLNSVVDLVISADPPNSTTVPGSYAASAENLSATSAYKAVVEVPLNVFANTVLK